MDAHSTHTHWCHIKACKKTQRKEAKNNRVRKTEKYFREKSVLYLINQILDFYARYSADKRGWRRPAVSFSGKQWLN